MPSGAQFTAITPFETQLVQDRVNRYQADFDLTNVSDQADIDTVVQFEVLIQRWNQHISSGVDEQGGLVDVNVLQRQVKDMTGSLLALKKQLGIDKTTRDKTQGEHSVAKYIGDLLDRAKQFGVNREEMNAKGIELAMELIHLVQLYDQSTEDERMNITVTQDDIMEWIRTTFRPQFEAVDKHFREHEQKFWIKDQ